MTRDVLVAGGGPTGLAVALHARRAGLDVEVWEPRLGAIDKACGEGLMPGAVAALGVLGVDPPGQALRGIRYVAGDRSVQASFRGEDGRGVRRITLHAALQTAVREADIPVVDRRASEVTQDDAGVTVDGTRARYLVAADGLHSPTRHALGLARTARTAPRHGLRRHVAVAPWTDHVEVHWCAEAEAYVTPVGTDLVGVALLTASRRSYAELLALFPALAARLHGEAASAVRGAGPLHQRTRARVAGRVLLVGDAAGYVDALTGEGIALGLAQAEAAVAALAADDPASYARSWRHLTRRYRLLTRGLLVAANTPAIRGRLVPAAVRLPRTFGLLVDQIARPA